MSANITSSPLSPEDSKLVERIADGALIESWQETGGRFRELATGIILQFADSEMAGAAGFADFIKRSPTIDDRINISRMVTEKMTMAREAYALLEGLNFNSARYVNGHCFDSRVLRDSFLGFSRSSADKRVNALLYPLESFEDMLVFTYLLATMAKLSLKEFSEASFKPLRTMAAAWLVTESSHAELALTAIKARAGQSDSRTQMQLSLDYWYGRVETSAGPTDSMRNEWHRRFGLKKSANVAVRDLWRDEILGELAKLGISSRAVGQ